MAASTAFYGTVRTIKSALTEILEMDKQITVLKRVAGDGVDTNEIMKESIRLASELGNKIADVNEGFIAFVRQGYRGEDLSYMAEYATLLGNISEMDVEESASILTAALKGFNLEAVEAARVVDSLNEVDNNYAITSQQLAQALQRSAGAANTYGVSLEKSIGYTTAIGEVTRESGSIIGNSLKSIYSRITSIQPAIDAMAEIGIATKESSGEMRDVSSILDDLGGKWQSLSAEQQQNLGLQIAGRFQLSRFLILMNQYNTALDATATAENSAGSGYRENAEYLKSYEAQINKVKNAWTEAVVAMRDSGLGDSMVFGLSAGLKFLNVLTLLIDKIGVLPVVLGTVSLAFLLMNGRAKATGTAINTGILSTLGKLSIVGNTARVSALLVGASFETMATKSKVAAVGINVLRGALSTVLPIAGIMAVSWAIGKLVTHTDEAKQKLEDFKSKNESVANSFNDNEAKIKNLSMQYGTLSKAVSDTTLTEEERAHHAKNLIGIQNELANLLPVLKEGEDEYGNAIILSSEAVEARIGLLERQAEAEKVVKDIKNAEDDKEIISLAAEEIEKEIAAQEKYYGKLTAMATEYSQTVGKIKIIDDEDIVTAQDKLATAEVALNQFREARNKAFEAGDTKTVDELDVVILKFTDMLTQAQASEAYIASSTYTAIEAQLNLVKSSISSIEGINDVGSSVVTAFTSVAGTVNASSGTVNKFFDEIRKEITANGAINQFVGAYQTAFADYVKAKAEVAKGEMDDTELKNYAKSVEETAKRVQDEISKIANLKGLDGENKFGFDDTQLDALESNMSGLVSTFAEGKLSAEMLKEALNLDDVQAAELLAMIGDEADGMGESLEEAGNKAYNLVSALDILSGVTEQQIQDADDLIWMFDEYANRLDNAAVGTVEYTQAQADLIGVQEQLASLYPHLIDLGDQSIASVMAQIDAVRQEVEAQDILRSAMKASRDGKLTADEDMAKSGLEKARTNIDNINEEIKALNRLMQVYAAVANRAVASADALAEAGFDEDAEDAYIRAQKFRGAADQQANSMDTYKASLSEAQATQKSYIDELKKSEAVMGNATTSANKATGAQLKKDKANEKTNKSQKKLNETTKKAIYFADNYADALRKIDLQMSKLNETKERYNEWDKEHIKALKEEMDLLTGKKALLQSQAADINNQIASGNHTQTGVVTYDTGSSSGAYTGKYAAEINKAAKTHNVDPFLIAAIIKAESGFNPNARSGAGAQGLMQLMPATARGLGVTNSYDPAQNIMGGTKYIAQQLKAFGNDIKMALAAYNAGPGNVRKYGGIPPFKETQNYVNKVTADYAKTSKGTGGTGSATTQAVQSAVAKSMSDYYLKGSFRSNQGVGHWRGQRQHTGLDLIAKSGTDIKSVKSGTVKSKGTIKGAGNYIDITQSDGTIARYLHMRDPSALVVGATVNAGDSVGKVGSTGSSTTPHLHLEIRDPKQKSVHKGDLSPSYGRALDTRAYLQNQVSPVQMSNSSSGSSNVQGQAEAQFASEKDKLYADLDSASQELLKMNQQIRAQRRAIWESGASKAKHDKEETDKVLQNSDNRLKKHDPASKEYRAELEAQKELLKNKQKYNQQEIDHWKKVQRSKGLTNQDQEYVKAKLHELGLEKNVIKFEIDDRAIAQLESYAARFEDRRGQIAKEYEYEQTKLEGLTHGSVQYFKTLEKIASLTDRNIGIDEHEAQKLRAAIKSGELYGASLKAAQERLVELRNSTADLRLEQQQNILFIVEQRGVAFDNKRGKRSQELEYEAAKLRDVDIASERYGKTQVKMSALMKNQQKTNKEELTYLENVLKTKKLNGTVTKELTDRIWELKISMQNLNAEIKDLDSERLNTLMEIHARKIADVSYEYSKSQAIMALFEEGSVEYAAELKKQTEILRQHRDAIVAQRNELQREILTLSLTAEQVENKKRLMQELTLEYWRLGGSIKDADKTLEESNKKMANDAADKLIDAYKSYISERRDAHMKSLDAEMKAEDKRHQKAMKNLSDEMTAYRKVVQEKIDSLNKGEEERSYNKEMDKLGESRVGILEKIQELAMDDSLEAKAQRKKLHEELAEVEETIAEKRHARELELRRENLDQMVEDKQEAISKEEEIENERHDKEVENLDKLKTYWEQHYTDLANDERKFAKIREDIIAGNFENISAEFGEFMEWLKSTMPDLENDLDGTMEAVGTSIRKNIIDSLQEALDLMAKINSGGSGGQIGSSTNGKPNGGIESVPKNPADELNGKATLSDASMKVMAGKFLSDKLRPQETKESRREAITNRARELAAEGRGEGSTIPTNKGFDELIGDLSPADRLKLAGYLRSRIGSMFSTPELKDFIANYTRVLESSGMGFRTGGSTGKGGLGLLHEDEFVLNKGQTKEAFKMADLFANLNRFINVIKAPSVAVQGAGGDTNYEINFHVDKMDGGTGDVNKFTKMFTDQLKRNKGVR